MTLYCDSDQLNPLYATFTGPSPSGSHQRLSPVQTSVLSPSLLSGIPRIEGNNLTPSIDFPFSFLLSVSAPDCQTGDNIYEELRKNNLETSEPIKGKIKTFHFYF